MFTRAKKILASELMYALDMEEKEAEEYLDEPARGRPTRSAPATAELAASLDAGDRAPSGGGLRRAPRGRDVPKALVELAGRPMAAWSLLAFQAAEADRARS